ncbi:replication initiation protein [Enterococcus faecalis]|uniref:replication initiation protein n=1 Tax=Enterococcus faecalis TaxID=1351 RepID=UPI004043636F
MTQLFSYIDLNVEGKAFFKFSEIAAPLVFQLKRDYYSFHLHELANIKSKYTLILMKLWQAKRMNTETTVEIKGTLEEWQTWFLDEEKCPAGRFKQKVLDIATKELCEKQNCSITIETLKRKRKVEGYQVLIHKDTKLP